MINPRTLTTVNFICVADFVGALNPNVFRSKAFSYRGMLFKTATYILLPILTVMVLYYLKGQKGKKSKLEVITISLEILLYCIIIVEVTNNNYQAHNYYKV